MTDAESHVESIRRRGRVRWRIHLQPIQALLTTRLKIIKLHCLVRVCFAALGISTSLVAQAEGFKPVTEEMLRNPPPGDWLNWRRTDNAWGYSPLQQITQDNVHQLQLVWSWAMEETAAQEAAPW